MLTETGWVSFYIRSERDVTHALWLLRLAYLNTLLQGRVQGETLPDLGAIAAELVRLHPGKHLAPILDDRLLHSPLN